MGAWFESIVALNYKAGPWKELVNIVVFLVFLPIFVLTFIYCFVISPLIREFWIVPSIEKKAGRKLGYSQLLSLSILPVYFTRDVEISKYIIDRYIACKKNDDCGVPSGYDRFALKAIGYTANLITRGELIYSYLYRINLNSMMVSFVIITIAACLNQY